MMIRRAKGEKRREKGLRFIGFTFLTLLLSPLASAIETPPRLYFSDAKLSFEIPDAWQIGALFPFGPLLTRKTQEGTEASIVCQISDPVNQTHVAADASLDLLKEFATRDLSTRSAGARTLAGAARALAGQNAYEVTWLMEGPEGATQYQSVYFFLDNRFYVLTLKATRDSFPWIVQDYQNWLATVHLLSRQDSGKLFAPSHGGVWVHQTGGAKVEIPEAWLIGVADDRQIGATLVRDKMSLAFTAVAGALTPAARAMSPDEKEEARRALKQKGRTLVMEFEDPFHGLPAYQIVYEYADLGRFIRGQDIWISSPKARWLFSVEGDSRLMRQMAEDWQGILRGIHFSE